MSLRLLLLGLSVGLLLVGAFHGENDKDAIRRWVVQLGSSKYAERDTATRMLQAQGAPALAELMYASREAKDAEVRLRARALIRKIRRQSEDAAILAGPRLRLVYKDTPLLEAVEDFVKKSGVQLMVEQEGIGLARRYPPEVARRRITLDTGETTFWPALEQFCRVSGLGEQGFVVAAPESKIALFDESVRRASLPRRDSPYRAIVYSNRFLLVDARPRSLPTQHVGRLRIRALPPGPAPAAEAEAKERFLDLDVMPDGGLRGIIVEGLTISKAVDDRGQHLQHRQLGPQDPPDDAFFASDGTSPGMQRWVVPMTFAASKERSAVLKELYGTITIRVLAPRSLIRVDEIVSRAGETVRGEEGGALRILQAQREDNGTIRLRMQMDPSAAPLVAGQGAPVVRVRTGIVALRGVDEDADQFALVDDAGRPWQRIEARRTFLDGAGHFEYELRYRPAADQKGPAHLVYSTTRAGIVNIPFRLRDVPLR